MVFKDKQRACVHRRRWKGPEGRAFTVSTKVQALGGGVPLVLQLGQEATTDATQSFSGSIKSIYISSKTPKTPPPLQPQKIMGGAIASVWNLVEPVVLVTNYSENQKL